MSIEKPTTHELEEDVVHYFNPFKCLILPNVMIKLQHLRYATCEADLVVVSDAQYATEVELKVSRNDLKADARKKHTHDASIFRRLFFAMPEEIIDEKLIPDRAGIIAYKLITHPARTMRQDGWDSPEYKYRKIEVIRKPIPNNKAPKVTQEQRQKWRDLAYYRLWRLKPKLVEYQKEIDRLKGKLNNVNGEVL